MAPRKRGPSLQRPGDSQRDSGAGALALTGMSSSEMSISSLSIKRTFRVEARLQHNRHMVPSLVNIPLHDQGSSARRFVGIANSANARGVDDLRFGRHHRSRRPGVPDYRIFMTIVFALIVLIDEWSDRSLSTGVGVDVIGSTSVVVWAFTLLGSFGIGPAPAIWDTLRR